VPRLVHPIPLGWLQLWHRKVRFAVALAGIAFAVMLILMQLGFRASLFESAVRYQRQLKYDLAIFARDSQYIVAPEEFSNRRLYQALAVEGVEAISPVYIGRAPWKDPYSLETRIIYILGLDPEDDVLDAPGVVEGRRLIRLQDVVLFDEASRPEYGPIAEHFRARETITTEVNDRQVRVGGLFTMGTSFGIDASLVTSHANFLRLFPIRPRNQIDLGLVRVADGVDPVVVRDRLRALLPEDVIVLTRDDFVLRETAYWNEATPIGFVFTFGALIGLVVGTVIVYQILFSDVSDHLAEYATLRAIGYSNGYISGVVIQQAMILGMLGYALGALAAIQLYGVTANATKLPMQLTPERAVGVLLTTIAMCAFSGLLALRRVRTLDPAEVF
jgi:putative ABC transport system permease protein